MRKFPLLIGLLACIPLAGCNWWPGHKPAPQRVTVTCHCEPPIRGAAGAAPVARHERHADHRRRRSARHTAHRYAYHSHRYARGSRRYLWNTRRAEASVDRYNYSSASRRYGRHRHGHATGYAGGYSQGWHAYGSGRHESQRAYGSDSGYAHHRALQRRYGRGAHIWVDGFGRRHIYDQSAVRYYSYQVHMQRKLLPERLDPWHGYNDDWD
jgi:hypothetical protein